MKAVIHKVDKICAVEALPAQKIIVRKNAFVICRGTGRTRYNEKSAINLEKGAAGHYNGQMSKATVRKVKKYVENWWLAVKEGRNYIKGKKPVPVFITLTLPGEQRHNDNFVKRHILGRWIAAMRHNGYMKNYLWRAEAQSNGKIHFHLITDYYVDKERVMQLWNSCLSDYGYIDSGKEPSTRVDGTNGLDGLLSYIAYYVTKEPKAETVNRWLYALPNAKMKSIKDETGSIVGSIRLISGRIWGCSDELRDIDSPAYDVSDDGGFLESKIMEWTARYLQRIGKPLEFLGDDFVTVLLCDTDKVLQAVPELRKFVIETRLNNLTLLYETDGRLQKRRSSHCRDNSPSVRGGGLYALSNAPPGYECSRNLAMAQRTNDLLQRSAGGGVDSYQFNLF